MDNIPYTVSPETTVKLTGEQFNTLMDQFSRLASQSKAAYEESERLMKASRDVQFRLQHYTTVEVAGFLRCSTRQVQRYVADGALVPRHIAGKPTFPAERVYQFALEHESADTARAVADLVSASLGAAMPSRRKTSTTHPKQDWPGAMPPAS